MNDKWNVQAMPSFGCFSFFSQKSNLNMYVCQFPASIFGHFSFKKQLRVLKNLKAAMGRGAPVLAVHVFVRDV